jgi:hypothetical protein
VGIGGSFFFLGVAMGEVGGGPGEEWRSLDKLCPCIRSKAEALLDRARAMHISVSVISTLRDEVRQRYYVQIGRSWTEKGKHLPQPPNGLALAFDLAPTEYLRLKNWWPEGPAWAELGHAGEALGLTWGVPGKVDKPHYQLSRCLCGGGK